MDEGVILLVEDNPDDVLLTQRALRQHRIGNQVIVAGDGEEALEYLQPASAEGPCPALILLDINLPKVNGLQVLEVLSGSARTRRLPVIVLTNSSHERDMVESLNLGAHSYITKPVVVPDFRDAVHILGLHWYLSAHPLPPDPRPADHRVPA